MPKFFENRESFRNNNVYLHGDNFVHITKVRRAEVGDEIVVTDNQGIDYICTINGIFKDHVSARIEDFGKNENEPNVDIYLFQCLPKFDKMDLIIQKCVEIGVHKIIPVSSARCVSVLEDDKALKKVARWQKISEAAAKQSERGIIPEISEVVSFEEAVKMASAFDVSFVPYEKEESRKLSNGDLLGKKSIGVFIGPEGGFEETEIELCIENKIIPVTLGKRILKSETAGMSALSIILFMCEG